MEPSNTPTPEQMPNVVPVPNSAPEPVVNVPNMTDTASTINMTETMTTMEVTEANPVDAATEEELKAPLKAAEPVPGSIGSAISVPASDGTSVGTSAQTPSVAFNDPAMQQNPMANTAPIKAQKKMSNTTLILLAVLGVAIIAVLVVVLIKLLSSGE